MFEKKAVIVTGGAKGIGREISLSFAREGANVTVLDTDESANAVLINEADDLGLSIQSYVVNTSNNLQVEKVVSKIFDLRNRVDILVNNAGISNPKTTEEMTAEEWDRVIRVNLSGAFYCVSAVIPIMKKAGTGKIVNISSSAGKRISFAGGIAYTASKAGVIGLTRHLAYELAPYGINVNCVCPGATMTPLYESITDEAIVEVRKKLIPAGRLCRPADIADAVLYLSSEKASMIYGVALDVDGGSLLGWMNVGEYYKKRKQVVQERGI